MASQNYVLDGQRRFVFPFPVQDPSDLRLQLFPGDIVSPDDYVVTGAGPGSQGVTVEWPSAPTNEDITLGIFRETPAERVTDFPNNQAVSARALNAEFDNIYQAIVDFIEVVEAEVDRIVNEVLPDAIEEEIGPFLEQAQLLVDEANAAVASAEGFADDAEESRQETAALKQQVENLLEEEIELQREGLGIQSLALYDATAGFLVTTDLGLLTPAAPFANEDSPTIEIDLAFDQGEDVNLGGLV